MNKEDAGVEKLLGEHDTTLLPKDRDCQSHQLSVDQVVPCKPAILAVIAGLILINDGLETSENTISHQPRC